MDCWLQWDRIVLNSMVESISLTYCRHCLYSITQRNTTWFCLPWFCFIVSDLPGLKDPSSKWLLSENFRWKERCQLVLSIVARDTRCRYLDTSTSWDLSGNAQILCPFSFPSLFLYLAVKKLYFRCRYRGSGQQLVCCQHRAIPVLLSFAKSRVFTHSIVWSIHRLFRHVSLVFRFVSTDSASDLFQDHLSSTVLY